MDQHDAQSIVRQYWNSRRITMAIPAITINDDILTYYTFHTTEQVIPFQRTFLSHQSWQRRSLPDWMHKKHNWPKYYQYIPYRWAVYYGKSLHIVEGIPDTLTLCQNGMPAIGTYNVNIISNPEWRKQFLEFIGYVKPKEVVVIPDPDAMKDVHDNVREWFTIFRELVPGCFFLDLRQLGENDVNALWQTGLSKADFLRTLASVKCETPTMPQEPKRIEHPVMVARAYAGQGVFGSVQAFVQHYKLPTFAEPNGWQRILCPCKVHSSEGDRTDVRIGAAGITEERNLRFVKFPRIKLHCFANCHEAAMLTAIDPNLRYEDLRI